MGSPVTKKKNHLRASLFEPFSHCQKWSKYLCQNRVKVVQILSSYYSPKGATCERKKPCPMSCAWKILYPFENFNTAISKGHTLSLLFLKRKYPATHAGFFRCLVLFH